MEMRPLTLTEWVAWRKPAWKEKAACRGMDPEIFFVERGGDVRPARAVCAGCPVRAECLEYALDELGTAYDCGLWAGTTPRERQRMRQERKREAA